VRAKNVGEKIVGKKCEKRFFIFTRISLPKNGEGGKARNNFSGNTLIVRAKNFRQKIVWKEVRKTFFLFNEYRDRKMGGKKARNNFSRNTLIVRAKNVG